MTGYGNRNPVPPPPHAGGPIRDDVAAHTWTGRVLMVATVVLALVAGVNFTFAVMVIPNLAGVDDHTFVEITQRFNANPAFPLSFTAALLLMVLATVLQARLAPGPAVRWVVAALVLYGVVIAITGVVHIPLNEEISAAGDPGEIGDLASVREAFEAPWVTWHIVRTVCCTAAIAALARALILHGHRSPRRTAT